MKFIYLLASAAAGWWLGTRATERIVDQRFAEWERRHRAVPAPAPAATPAATAAPATTLDEELSPEIIMVLSAAVAAFLGKKARIRQVRRIPTVGFNPWAQQGRATIQASHNLNLPRHGGE
jgi:methylmalonyl-CoA carboxyltransferase large subunit